MSDEPPTRTFQSEVVDEDLEHDAGGPLTQVEGTWTVELPREISVTLPRYDDEGGEVVEKEFVTDTITVSASTVMGEPETAVALRVDGENEWTGEYVRNRSMEQAVVDFEEKHL